MQQTASGIDNVGIKMKHRVSFFNILGRDSLQEWKL